MSSNTYQLVRSNLARQTPLLGVLVWWSLADARVPLSQLQSIWAGANLDPQYLPEQPTPEKALKTSARETQVGQRDRLIRLGLESDSQIVFAILREQRDALNGSVDFHQEARVLLARDTGSLTTDVPGHDLASAVEARFHELLHTVTADDVRRCVLKQLDALACVPLRGHGGVYFIGNPHLAVVERLQTAVAQVGNSQLFMLPVHRSEQTQATLGQVTRGAMEQELDGLRKELEEFFAAPPDRLSTLVRRMDQYEGLKQRLALYSTVLRVELTDLEQGLQTLTGRLEQLVTQQEKQKHAA